MRSCKKKCLENINENIRKQIFEKFRSFDTKNEQDAYLQGLIEAKPVQRKRPRTEDPQKSKSHSSTYVYWISHSEGKQKVCKDAFKSVHGVTADRIRRLTKLLAEGKVPKDLRGLSKPGNSKPREIIDKIKSHIGSFPVKEAHYTSRSYHYLSEKLNVKIMHQLFLEKFPGSDVKYKFYLKIFQQHFSLSFGRPQIDTCVTCEELQLKIKSKYLNDNAKRAAVAEKVVHLRRAKKFYTQMDHIKTVCQQHENTAGICIDYMQNLFLPAIPVQDTFYLHQLTVNVFNIHDLRTGKAWFYIYHEGYEKKSPNEVCSFLMDYIEREISSDVKHLHIFSDGCAGQSKNYTVIRMCSALVEVGRFRSVDQYFPIRGHSYMPCDRDFATLKRKIKKFDRVYMLKEYVELFITSSQKNNFSVYLMDSDNTIIKDYKKWWPKFYRKNCLSQGSYARDVPKENKQPFTISFFNHFTHNEDTKGYVVARPFINGFVQHTFHLSYSKVAAFPSQLAYPDKKIPIKKKKMATLKKFRRFLQDVHVEGAQAFYEELFQWPTVDGEVDE